MNLLTEDLDLFSARDSGFLAVMDQQGILIRCNDRWEQVLGRPMQDLIQTPLADTLLETDRSTWASFLTQVQEKGSLNHLYLHLVGHNKNLVTLQFDLTYNNQHIYLRGTDHTREDREHTALQIISRLSNAGAWFHHTATNDFYWSELTYEVFGLAESDELHIKRIENLYEPPFRGTLKVAIKDLYEQHESFEHIGQIVTPGGKRKWVCVLAEPVVHEGELIGVNGIATDISHQQLMRQSIAENKHLRDLALKGIKSGLFFHDLKRNVVTYGNEFRHLLGIDSANEEVPEPEFRELIVDEDRDAAFARHLQELEKSDPHYFNHYRLKHQNGEVHHYEVHAWKRNSNEGQTIQMVGNLIDVEARIQAERRNKDYLNRLEAVINNGFTYTFLLDRDATVLHADQNSVMITQQEFGINLLEERAHFTKVIPSHFTESFEREFGRALKGFTVRKEIERMLDTGVNHWLDILYRPIKNNEEVTSVLITFMDITERKMAELASRDARQKSEQLNVLKSSILSNLSHEIRTPLNGIQGSIDLLESTTLDDMQEQILEIQKESADRLLQTLTGLVNLSKIRSDKSTLTVESTNVQDQLTVTYKKHRHMASRKALDIELNLPNEQVSMLVNPEMFEVSIDNLVNNAIKYTEKGSIKITADDHPDMPEMVRIRVCDTGIGIASENLGHIFEDFVQESHGLDRKFEGTGIGLSLTRRYIELMGGQIHVISKLGSGSTFTISVPREQAKAS